MPVRLGVRPTMSRQGCQSLPSAVGGSAARELGDRAHHMGNEGVRVRTRPGVVGAEGLVGIARHRLPDLRDQPLGLRPLDDDDRMRRVAEPAPIRRPAVGADRAAPADLVVAGVVARAGLLHHHPGVVGEDAAPAADPRRIDRDDGLGRLGCHRQELGARPIGGNPVRRDIVAHGPPERMSPERKEKQADDDEKDAGQKDEHHGKVTCAA